MILEGDASRKGVLLRMALGEGALEDELGSSWSDFGNCGCSREGPM